MKLRVQNYQSIRDANLVIEGLTVLKGASNQGKSSILKALYAATHNRFRRGAVTWGEDSCVVLVQYTGETKILRVERAASGASPKVRLGNKAEGYQTFGKMNRDLPAPVADYNNFGYVQLTPQEKLTLNFNPQFSKPLMVQFSNKKIVDILSYSKATEDAQHAYKQITERNQELKGALVEIDSAISSTKQSIGEIEKEFLKFKDYDKIEEIESALTSQEQKVEDLLNLRQLIAESTLLSERLLKEVEISKAAYNTQLNLEPVNTLQELSQIQSEEASLKKSCEVAQLIIEQAEESLNGEQLVSTLTGLVQALKDKQETLARGKKQRKVQLAIPDTERYDDLKLLKELLSQKKDFVLEVEEAQSALENATCPVCGTPLNLHA